MKVNAFNVSGIACFLIGALWLREGVEVSLVWLPFLLVIAGVGLLAYDRRLANRDSEARGRELNERLRRDYHEEQ